MKLFWIMDWNDGTPERDGDAGHTDCPAEWPDEEHFLDEEHNPGVPAEERVAVFARAKAEAAVATRDALRRLVEDLPLGYLVNEDWVLKVSPHGVILEDEDYDEEAAVRG